MFKITNTVSSFGTSKTETQTTVRKISEGFRMIGETV